LNDQRTSTPVLCQKSSCEPGNDATLTGQEARKFYESVVCSDTKGVEIQTQKTELRRCEICQSFIPETPDMIKQHFSSLSHQVAEMAAKPQRPSALVIPPSNRGYCMLRRIGWTDPAFDTIDGTSDAPVILDSDDCELVKHVTYPSGGLGVDGKGRRNPVATILKRDRLGLGWPNANCKSKVTHFAPKDPLAVRHVRSARLAGRLERDRRLPERRVQRDRFNERRIREQLSLSDEQFMALYGSG
uniref:G-patch domain-containing protein n=1 Tax=Echinostoma caproni TaxID=27848 RepID=A0A183BFL0_9TREM